MQREPAILVDMDGTLADITQRRNFLEGKKDWKSFNRGMDQDALHLWCREIVSRFLSARW